MEHFGVLREGGCRRSSLLLCDSQCSTRPRLAPVQAAHRQRSIPCRRRVHATCVAQRPAYATSHLVKMRASSGPSPAKQQGKQSTELSNQYAPLRLRPAGLAQTELSARKQFSRACGIFGILMHTFWKADQFPVKPGRKGIRPAERGHVKNQSGKPHR